MKVPICGGFSLGNPTKQLQTLLGGISVFEYGSEEFQVRLFEYCSVAYLIERPTQEAQAEQYSDTVLIVVISMSWLSAQVQSCGLCATCFNSFC